MESEAPIKLAQKDVDARWTKKNNKEKSKTRARVVRLADGFVENSMNGSFIRTIGIARAKAKIGMIHPVG